MTLRHLARLVVLVGAALSLVAARRQPSRNPARSVSSSACRPAARSTPTPASIADHMAKTLGQSDHRREQGPARAATSPRSTSPISRPTAASSGSPPRPSSKSCRTCSRIRAGPSTVSSRSSPVSRRRWCSSSIRAYRPRDVPGVPRLGEAEQGQAQLLFLSGRHAGALPRLPDEREVRSRSHSRAVRRLRTAGQSLARRPLAVRLRAGELDVPASCEPASSGRSA